MAFRQAEVLDELQLSRATFCNWRKAIRAFAGRTGAGAIYSSGDVLALKAIKFLVANREMRISKVGAQCGPLIDLCRYENWGKLRNAGVVYDQRTGAVEALPEEAQRKVKSSYTEVTIPVGELLSELEANMNRDIHNRVCG